MNLLKCARKFMCYGFTWINENMITCFGKDYSLKKYVAYEFIVNTDFMTYKKQWAIFLVKISWQIIKNFLIKCAIRNVFKYVIDIMQTTKIFH